MCRNWHSTPFIYNLQFFAAESAIALLGVLFDRKYINLSNIINNLHIYRRKEGTKKWCGKGGINRYLS